MSPLSSRACNERLLRALEIRKIWDWSHWLAGGEKSVCHSVAAPAAALPGRTRGPGAPFLYTLYLASPPRRPQLARLPACAPRAALFGAGARPPATFFVPLSAPFRAGLFNLVPTGPRVSRSPLPPPAAAAGRVPPPGAGARGG